MSRKSKRITHMGKNDEGPPIYQEFVSGIIKEMDSNKYGDKIIAFNLLKQRKTVNKTNSKNKCNNKLTVSKKRPLMEKTQKSVKYLKHNRKIPKQRAHVASFEVISKPPVKKKTEKFTKCIKDTKLKSQKRSVKNLKLLNENVSITSKKRGKRKFNSYQSDSNSKTSNLKNTYVTGASNEFNDKNAQAGSDSEDRYENFIRSNKVASNGGVVKTVKHRRKKRKKFKRIQIHSDSESDCETPNKVHKKISHDEPSKVDFNVPKSSNVDCMKPKAVSEGKYPALNKNNFRKVNSDFSISFNKPETLNMISNDYGCSERLVRNPFLDRESLSDEVFENNLKQDISKNNLSLSGDRKHISSNNREIDGAHISNLTSQNNFENDLDFSDQDLLSDTFLENILGQGNSQNNLNLSDNTKYMPSYNDRIDECLVLRNNSPKNFDSLDPEVISDTRLENSLEHNNSINYRTVQTYNMQQLVSHNEGNYGISSNRSNSSDNTPSNIHNSVGECHILKNNFKNAAVNRSNLNGELLGKDYNNEDCLILCEVPKFSRNMFDIKIKGDFVNKSNLDGNLLRKDSNDEDCLILYEAPKVPQSLSEIINKDDFVNRSNLDGNLLHKVANNEEMDEKSYMLCEIPKCPQILSDIQLKDESVNRSNLDGNLFSKTTNNEEIDEFRRILCEVKELSQKFSDIRKDDSNNKRHQDGNLLPEDTNNGETDEECLILCEVPKCLPNSLDIKTKHKKSEQSSNHADENNLKVNFPILSKNSANSETIDKTLMLNENQSSSFVNIAHSVQNYVSDVISNSKSDQFGKNTYNSNYHPNLLNKDYFKHAERYCNPVSDKKNKPN